MVKVVETFSVVANEDEDLVLITKRTRAEAEQ